MEEKIFQPKLESTLEKWDKIGRYSEWIYSQYKSFIGKKVFDVGIGIGTMTDFYIPDAEFVFGADIFDSQLELVRQRFKAFKFTAEKIDLEKHEIAYLAEYNFDTVIMINVLEHIENDLAVLKKIKSILPIGGRIIIFVPALPFLFNSFDKAAGHYRRYTVGMLKTLAEKASMKPLKCRYFNFLGVFPYFIKGVLSQGTTFSGTLKEGDSKLYNIASVLLAPIEKVFPPLLGLSSLIILEKSK